MHRSLFATVLAVFIATLQVAHPISAKQAVDAFRVSTSQLADVHQQTLEAFNPASKRTTEVFPGTYASPYGASLMTRIEDLFTRVGEADRAALLADKVGAGFDRSITSWRAHPAGRTAALAVRYYRDRLSSHLGMELSDDYGRPEPLDAAEYEVFTVAVCSRTDADTWTCHEELLAAVARKHDMALPNDRAGRDAATEKLLELVLADIARR
jgi:hypothetical protein